MKFRIIASLAVIVVLIILAMMTDDEPRKSTPSYSSTPMKNDDAFRNLKVN